MVKTFHFKVSQIGDEKYPLIEILNTNTNRGMVIDGTIEKDFEFDGTWTEILKKLNIKRVKLP